MIGKMTSMGGKGAAHRIVDYLVYDKEINLGDKEKLTVNDVRGEIIYIQNLALNFLEDGRIETNYLAEQLEDSGRRNTKLHDYLWHQSFSFPITENPSNSVMEEITKDFAKEFGFENNQLIAVKHQDKDHAHFHILGNRINVDGKTTASDSYSFLRSGDFCRKMEIKYNLGITPNMKALLPKEERIEAFSQSKIADSIRQKIDTYLPKVQSIDELKTALKKEGVKMLIGRGVAFVEAKSGAKFKGSDLGREYSLQNLQKRMDNPILKQNPLNQNFIKSNKSTTLRKDTKVDSNSTHNSKIILPSSQTKNNIQSANYFTDEDEELEIIKRQIRRR